MSNDNNIDRNITNENKINFLQKIKNTLTDKPIKKIYRICLLALIAIVANNTTGTNISDLLFNVLQQRVCQNHTESFS